MSLDLALASCQAAFETPPDEVNEEGLTRCPDCQPCTFCDPDGQPCEDCDGATPCPRCGGTFFIPDYDHPDYCERCGLSGKCRLCNEDYGQ